MQGGTGAGVYGQSVRRLSFSLGKYATVFQAEVHAILACVQEMKVHGIAEKHMSICSDSQGGPESSQSRQNVTTGLSMPKVVK
jgi:hypothetical protein